MKLIKSFNPMTRLINWMIKPLLPIRLFATDDDDDTGSDYGEYLGTDEDGQSYFVDDDGTITMTDSDGNVLASEEKDEWADYSDSDSSDDYTEVTYDTDTEHTFTFDDNGNLVYADGANAGETVDTSGWGNAIGVGNENGLVAGYHYAGTDPKGNAYYEDANGRKLSSQQFDEQLHKYGGEASAKVADNVTKVMGNTLNSKNLDNISKSIDMFGYETVRQAYADAADGNSAAKVMTGVMSGTIPPSATVNEAKAISEIVERVQNGEGFKQAFYSVNDAYGFTANEKMNQMLKDLAIDVALTYGTMGLGMGIGNLSKQGAKTTQYLQKARDVMNKLGVGGKYLGSKGRVTINTAARAMNDLEKGLSRVSVIEGLVADGMSLEDARAFVNGLDEGKNQNYYDELGQSAIRNTKTEKTPETTTVAAKPEPAPEPAKTTEKTPEDTSKAAGITFNPTYTGGISFPTNVGVDWIEVERGREKEPEVKPEPEAEGFDSESGDDTLETTTQDAPTGGVGTDTFTNTNTDQGKKGWGLGEEDPNRANYDVDKWNRGMERVSTDVVSDAKCKDFITKTFKDDPVLIKTVKIMKSKK